MRTQLRKALFRFTVLSLLVLGVAVPAHAVTVGLEGIVNATQGVNPYSIVPGSLVSGSATFDAAAAAAAPGGVLSFLDDPTMALDFNVGTFSFSTASPFANVLNLEFEFIAGLFQGIDLLSVPNVDGWLLAIAFDDTLNTNDFLMVDVNELNNVVLGTVSPVPVPATLILVVAGALTSAGVIRRRARS